MARRPAARSHKPTRRIAAAFKPSSPWPHIEEFLESGGNIQIGRVSPLGYVAVASDNYIMPAALILNPGETLIELMQRLDTAVNQALNHDKLTDEINGL